VIVAEIRNQLLSKKLPVGKITLLGFAVGEEKMSVHFDKEAQSFFNLSTDIVDVRSVDKNTDPRTIYFIPYDPDIDQDAEEKAFSLKILHLRMLSTMIVGIGRAEIPSQKIFDYRVLLNDATLGMFEQWENKESAKHMRNLCKQFLTAIAKQIDGRIKRVVTVDDTPSWKFGIDTDETKEIVLDVLMRISPDTLELLPIPEPNLFEN
jgi:hypothetical protein